MKREQNKAMLVIQKIDRLILYKKFDNFIIQNKSSMRDLNKLKEQFYVSMWTSSEKNPSLYVLFLEYLVFSLPIDE